MQAISTIFYQSLGISYTELGILWIALAATQMVLELPLGLLCDFIGRKKTMALGYFFYSLTFLCIGTSQTFEQVFLGCILWGISIAFSSGAVDAFLFDTLKHNHCERDFAQYKGYQTFIKSLAIMLASISGALMYTYHVRMPWVAYATTSFISSFIILMVDEPLLTKTKITLHTQYKHIKESLIFTFKNKQVLWLIYYQCLIIYPFYSYHLVKQPFFISKGFDIIHLGVIFAFTEGLSSLCSFASKYIEHRFQPKWVLSFFPISQFIFLISSAWIPNQTSIIAIIFLVMSFKMTIIFVSHYLNLKIESRQRATILSIQSLMSSIVQLLFMGISGVIVDLYSLEILFYSLAGFILITVFPMCLVNFKNLSHRD